MEEDIKILVDLIFEIKKLGLDEEKAQAIENLINRVKELEEFKAEHKIMKRLLVENNLWERLLNDDEFIEYLEDK